MNGLLLKLDTSGAIVGMERLGQTTDQVFDKIGRQGKATEQLEKQFVSLGTAGERLYQQSKPGGLFLPDTFAAPAKSAKKFGDELTGLGAKGQKTSQDLGKAFGGGGGNALAELFTKIAGAAGQRGAAAGVGIFAGAARALGSTINPLGIAIGFLGGELIEYVGKSLNAKSATEKLREEAKEAQKDFTNFGTAIGKINETFAALTSARNIGGGFTSEVEEAKRLQNVLAAIEKSSTTIGTQQDRQIGGNSIKLTIEQIKELGEALQKSPQFFRDLELAANQTGKQAEQAFARLQTQIGLRREEGTLVVTAAQAQKLLGDAYNETLVSINANNRALEERAQIKKAFDEEQEIRGIADAQAKSLADEKLGNREREATIKLREFQVKLNRELTPTEAEIAKTTLATAKAADAEKAALEKATKEREEAKQKLKEEQREREQLVKDYQTSIAGLQLEAALIGLDERERDKLRLTLELENKARLANGKLTEDEQRKIQATITNLNNAKTQAEARAEAQREATEAGREALRQDEARVKVLRDLNLETQLYLASNKKDIEERQRLIEVNNRLDQVGVKRESSEGRQIELAVRRNEAAKAYAVRLEEIGNKGEQVGQAVGGAFGEAAFASGNFGRNLANAFQQLLALETKRALVEALGAAFRGLGTALFSSSPTARVGDTNFSSPLQQSSTAGGARYFARGGFLGGAGILAARGQVFDRATTLAYGSMGVGIAEGGPSTPEAVVPLSRDRFGRLGLSAPAGGGGTFNIYIDGARSADDLSRSRPTMMQMVGEIDRARGRYNGSRR